MKILSFVMGSVADSEKSLAPSGSSARDKRVDGWADVDAQRGWSEAAKPLTRDEAEQLRRASPSLSPWWVVTGQLIAGVLVASMAWLVTGRQNAGWSAFYGALTVVVPAALLARGLASKLLSINPGAAVAGFFLWEMVKVATSVGMLFAAPRLVTNLDWLALLIGLMVTVQVYWVALLMRPKPKSD